jgi:hypothetical protein
MGKTVLIGVNLCQKNEFEKTNPISSFGVLSTACWSRKNKANLPVGKSAQAPI